MRIGSWIIRSAVASAAACGVAAIWTLAGCTAPRRPLVVTDPDPSVKIPAYKKAVRERDRDAAPQLVADLESDDPAVRLFAIEALQIVTGETFGYRYFDDEEDRRVSVAKWQAWLKERPGDAV
jgi:hypothetical protein